MLTWEPQALADADEHDALGADLVDVVAGGGEDACPWVGLERVAAELLRHYHHRLKRALRGQDLLTGPAGSPGLEPPTGHPTP